MIQVTELIRQVTEHLDGLELAEKVRCLNAIRAELHDHSPFKNEPVDLVQWVLSGDVVANDYNPNKVAPPEMQLLEVSILNDGYTQPIVTFPNEEKQEVIDGFHRSRVGKESRVVNDRVMNYLPVVSIRKEKEGKAERIASTIRHNRARGKHQVSAMSEIVIELKNRNWNNKRIANELGMDEDEILRLCQISGLEGMFKDADFNKAWVSDGCADDTFEELDDEVNEDEMAAYKIPNEADPDRVFHHYSKWEAYQYNFFGLSHKTMSKTQCEYAYKMLLIDTDRFREILNIVTSEWVYSCEHNLTNKSMNRIAWLGQAALAYEYQIPSIYCAGFQLLSDEEQQAANEVALEALNGWLVRRGMNPVSMDEGLLVGRQVELY